jgi:hypothetical protein
MLGDGGSSPRFMSGASIMNSSTRHRAAVDTF